MSIRNTGLSIKEARRYSGLSQEKLSENICSVTELSRIERGLTNPSSITFSALMNRAGVPCTKLPVFENWNDYDVFSDLIHARFHLDAWQLDSAFNALKSAESKRWNHNKLHYQAWLMLYGMLLLRSGTSKHQYMYDIFLSALHITKPLIDLNSIHKNLFSVQEIELLICIAQEMLELNQPDHCYVLCDQINSYISDLHLSVNEKVCLLAECAVVKIRYLITQENFHQAKEIADFHLHQIKVNSYSSPLFELSFFEGVCDYFLSNSQSALLHFIDILYAAQKINSPFAIHIEKFLDEHNLIVSDKSLPQRKSLILKNFPSKEVVDYSDFSDGIFDKNSPEIITVGKLIYKLRIKQQISQKTLCQGLCSKAHLSKIETGVKDPSVILARTLLQRLGVSDGEFLFWSGHRNSILGKADYKLEQKDTLYLQHALFEKSYSFMETEERIENLKNILHITLRDFDISRINDYRLSRLELEIIQSIALEFIHEGKLSTGLFYIRQCINYHHHHHTDSILQANTLTHNLHALFRCLYLQNQEQEILNEFSELDLNICKYNLYDYRPIFFYYLYAKEHATDDHLRDIYALGINRLSGNAKELSVMIDDLLDLLKHNAD